MDNLARDEHHDYLLDTLEKSRRKLLDLSRRNRLLNYRETARDIGFIDEMPDQVYERLRGGDAFALDPLAAEHADADEIDRALPNSRHRDSEVEERYTDDRLQTPFSEADLERRLRKLHADHRTAIEETGANVLYLAMGFLRWNEREDSEATFKSPLLMIPVRLERERGFGASVFKLLFDEQDLDTNYSLAEKLWHDFDIRLPTVDDDATPEAYWRSVEEAIGPSRRARWSVEREMALGLFRFQKQVMWHDLDPARWPTHASLLDKGMLRRVLLGPREGEAPPGQLSHEYAQDGEEANGAHRDMALVRDADSSQFAALVDALDCQEGLVIEGPPGTGKSQTITNLIAAALGMGKSVLFVAEKMAALEVVSKRLKESGLSDFCLELHGLKTSRKELLADLQHRANLQVSSPHDLERRRRELELVRQDLVALSSALRQPLGPERLPVHEAVWRLERLRGELPEGFEGLPVDDPTRVDWEDFSTARNFLADLGREWAAIPADARNGWAGFFPAAGDDGACGDAAQAVEQGLSAVRKAGAWMTDSGLASAAAQPFTVFRLLKLAKVEDGNIGSVPASAGAALAHAVLNRQRLPELRELVTKVETFLCEVKRVNRYFDYAAADADSHARVLRAHCESLARDVCPGEATRLGDLAAERDALSDVLDGLQALASMAEPLRGITGRIFRTLDDYEAAAREAEQLTLGPAELSLFGDPMLARRVAPSYLLQAREEQAALTEIAERSLAEFRLESVPDAASVGEVLDRLTSAKGQWFAFLNADYRRAKAVVRRWLRDPRIYSQKAESQDRLSTLRAFCERRERFAANRDFRAALGGLFSGTETNWQQLEGLVDFAQSLAERIGFDHAAVALRDWDCHVESMAGVARGLRQTVERARVYGASHRFPNALWQRPAVEIVAALRPWVQRLDAAGKELGQGWCHDAATLDEGLAAARGYDNAKRLERDIDQWQDLDEALRRCWQGVATPVHGLRELLDWMDRCLVAPGMGEDVLRWLVPSAEGFDPARLADLQSQCGALRHALLAQMRTLAGRGELKQGEWLGDANASLTTLQEKLTRCQETLVHLPVLAQWCRLHDMASAHGLEPYAKAVVAGDFPADAAAAAYEFSLYRSLLGQRFAQEPRLAAFGQGQYEGARERFSTLDRELFALNGRAIASKLCAVPVPQGNGYGRAADFTEKRLLDREANKKTRHIPVRQLVSRAKNSVQVLKPCFLMSPMSVAQYLPPGEIEFDLVVMDEASQIRPEEALGAIARGRQAVIVGDPKQLPPTSFFDSAVADGDEELEETILDDTESILDVCLKQLPFRRLRWHYRSQHEALIQFSNERFYDGDLVVFPSPKRAARDFGVHSTYIAEPSYKTGRNRGEVEVVVQNIVHHFRRWPDRSLGVAAFNKRQAEEIELALDWARRKHPDLDEHISNHQAREPLFIKNLENVQGDERDVIFISTTYGPETPGGTVFQRFGPINSDLGWRRLNVIATRARQRVEVFTSMRPTDIRLAEGCKRGARALRDYLEYAETGRVPELGTLTGREPDSEFEVTVAALIRECGYECEPQVGVAGFFIDIGVVHPDRPGEFLMGVECDGATYHSARSVRDRDRLRQEVLESKGWHIHRIWSTSWFQARNAEVDRLRRAIEERLKEDQARYVPAVVGPVECNEALAAEAPAAYETAPVSDFVAEVTEATESDPDSLEEALERFWHQNIRPEFPDRSRSILAPEAMACVARDGPYTEEMWFRSVPERVRTQMDGRERQLFLDDMFQLVIEYT